MASLRESRLPSVTELAAANRARLFAGWPTAEQAGLAMGIEPSEASRLVGQYHRQAKLLGVNVVEPTRHWRFPTWQFDAEHRPLEGFADVLAILHQHGNFLSEGGQTNGWCEVEWFLTPHALLDGKPPCELLARDVNAVLKAAREQFVEDSSDGGF